MLWHVVERGRRAGFEAPVVATSEDASDDPVADFCKQNGITCVRGSLNDVLARYYAAAKEAKADVVIRLTGDCPLLDPAIIRRTVELHQAGQYDYVSNCDPPTFPDGLDTEVFSFQMLERAFTEAKLPSEREHVTTYFPKHPELFRLGNLANTENLSIWRWTVDEPRDLEFVRSIYGLIGSNDFGMQHVVDLLRSHPELLEINQGIVRNAGHASALKKDEEFLAQNS